MFKRQAEKLVERRLGVAVDVKGMEEVLCRINGATGQKSKVTCKQREELLSAAAAKGWFPCDQRWCGLRLRLWVYRKKKERKK